jgi:uridine phosphorylase
MPVHLHPTAPLASRALLPGDPSRALGGDGRVAAHEELVAALQRAAGTNGARMGAVASSDLFYDRDAERALRWRAAGALAVEMEAATLLRVGELRGVRIGCLLAVSDVFDAAGARQRIDADALLKAAEALGQVGAAALMAV